MANYAIVDGNGNIINTVLWDGVAEWSPEEGQTAVLNDEPPFYTIGGTLIDGIYTPPEEV